MTANLLLKNKRSDQESISDNLRTMLESIGTKCSIEEGRYLFHSGMDAEEIYLIQSGIIEMTQLTADGKELSLRICHSGDIIGELILFNDNATYFLSAKILQSGEVLAINKAKLEEQLVNNAELTFEYMKWASNHTRKLQSKIRDMMLNGKKGALYSTLIRLSNSYGIKQYEGTLIDIPLTNRELARFCAATRESVNRMLSELRRQGVISIEDSGRIMIKNMSFLREEINCESCPIEICNIN